MKTFEIDIPDDTYYRAIDHAKKMNISFDEFCALSIEHLFAKTLKPKHHRRSSSPKRTQNKRAKP